MSLCHSASAAILSKLPSSSARLGAVGDESNAVRISSDRHNEIDFGTVLLLGVLLDLVGEGHSVGRLPGMIEYDRTKAIMDVSSSPVFRRRKL